MWEPNVVHNINQVFSPLIYKKKTSHLNHGSHNSMGYYGYEVLGSLYNVFMKLTDV
jgi:hypothetical protein